ncbi:D-2-hydroxyglutarate dehydrogenase OS=Castellaniella defragrans (strain DSM / CCUG 39792 / 65Phen)OX=1437824 GN=BN940_08606 PE=3 SV=1 [Castellaniella denitrificans]|uniref:FAD-binding oxidoreductase n=1 Tax=Castellaniella sp. TaxID=1955812 RepID=UPI002AFF2B4E|nr:FAD-binding oxidoreductase [Castellaniella sp.]
MTDMSAIRSDDEILLTRLRAALGADRVRAGSGISDKYLGDWSTEKGGRPVAVVLPDDTADVSRVLAVCHELRRPVVPQGGLTGLAGGAVPAEGAVALSLERMNRIEALDADAATLTAQAGVPLQVIQEAAVAAGFLCGLDLGARGSCQIGGNISTNAGGNRVIRYGMTRDLVLGLEVVLPDGTVLSMMNQMTKNNTGIDLKQLFIGSEGTLGIVTRAVLKLHPGIAGANTALVALNGFESALALLRHARQALSGRVSAFELMWADYYRAATTLGGARAPLAPDHPLYVLMDMQSPLPQEDAPRFEAVLEHALAEGWAVDAAIAQSHGDAEDFWALRDSIAEMLPKLAPTINFDVSVPVSSIGMCVERMRAAMENGFPGIAHMYFGHVGDGNVHIVAGPLPQDGGQTEHAIEQAFYTIVRELSGSVSAEHGIGLHKRPWLEYSRRPAEIQLMRTLKQALDPRGIMNPGKIIAS